MKKAIGIIAVILVLAASVATFVAITHNPEKQILGKWSDSDGTSGYEFTEGGKVTMTYANFTIPILDIPFQGDVEGTYTLDKKADTITLQGTFFTRSVSITYDYKFKGDTLTLTSSSSGKSITYFKQESTTK